MTETARHVAHDVAREIRSYLDHPATSAPAARMPRKLYIGTAYGAPVTVVEGNLRTPLAHHVRHSPDGFSWGYAGSGCAELARCLLWDAIGEEPTEDLFQEFKRQVVADLPERKSWQLTQAAILAWVAFHTSGLNDRCVDCGGDLIDHDPPRAGLYVEATTERCGECEGQRVDEAVRS